MTIIFITEGGFIENKNRIELPKKKKEEKLLIVQKGFAPNIAIYTFDEMSIF